MSRPASRTRNMPPPSRRGLNSLRAASVTPSLDGRASPAESMASTSTRNIRSPLGSSIAGSKRKEREYDRDVPSNISETNINVVVRCRGRNEREVRENSGVVIQTDGVKGKTVELSLGQNLSGNKTYTFDKVFSPAADQTMMFDEVVKPILDEVLRGLNCTIFAYGQTGTGKTYTMSGDISDQLPLPDDAGIIPRLLHALFERLDALPNSPTTGAQPESSVKASFIELYNEELRDLFSADDGVKVKIYDGDTKRGQAATLVQGMEEKYITSASNGLKLLRHGSHKRQVAATKCNDLSSRSHTIFTVTVYTKRTLENGEEILYAGKLNLVDLAGSENIKRSEAENKRATEAGLINKSLTALGRVINALVDKQKHIPYRESNLTRLLQDSLGGETKTCIIATVSPARSNFQETVSTLNYAFRAKNIRNKPQVHQIPKKTLLKELTIEIEKLKSELMVTRQRNGVYLTQETYDNMMNESESRRILSQEQRDKIETMECNLRNKVQELFNLAGLFKNLKEDNEATKAVLDSTKGVLEKTEAVLDFTKKSLDEETFVRRQHEQTEAKLAALGDNLLSTLGQTTADIGGLHSKLRRRSDLHSMNRQHWIDAQIQVSQTTTLVEDRMDELQTEQQALVNSLSSRMHSFVEDELQQLQSARTELEQKSTDFAKSHAEVNEQTAHSRDELNHVLEEVTTLREDVKDKVGAGLNDLGIAAQRISAGIMTEIESFHTQLHSSYAALGRDFKSVFDDLLHELNEQRDEVGRLKSQISEANNKLSQDNMASADQLQALVAEDKAAREQENKNLMLRIQELVEANAKQQELRMQEIGKAPSQIRQSQQAHEKIHSDFVRGNDQWLERANEFGQKVTKARDTIKTKIQGDFCDAIKHAENLKTVTSSVHDETTRIVDEQVRHLDTELKALDGVVGRIQEQNHSHHAAHEASLDRLASNVQASYGSLESTFAASFVRIESVKGDVSQTTSSLQDTLPSLAADSHIRRPLSEMREQMESRALDEYSVTGLTPGRKDYTYPTNIPRTEPRELLLSKLRNGASPEEDDIISFSGNGSGPARSPSKGLVFADLPDLDKPSALNKRPGTASSSGTTTSLRELDPNALGASLPPAIPEADASMPLPPLKKIHTSGAETKRKRGLRTTVAGNGFMAERENVTLPNLSASVGVGALHPAGRRLRSHERNGVR